MKITVLLTIACLTPSLFNACSTGSGYSEWKSNNPGPSGGANPYGVPRAGGEPGSYPQAPQSTAALTNDLAASNPTPAGATTTYTVVAGDSLWGIARKNNTSVQAIQSANALSNTTIQVGQRLTIPAN